MNQLKKHAWLNSIRRAGIILRGDLPDRFSVVAAQRDERLNFRDVLAL